jgi:hypothetical protein
MSSFFDSASLVQIPSGYSDGTLYSVKPIDGSGDLTFTRSIDSATRVASNGLIQKVRTNLVLQSETFNTTWAVNGIVVTPNTAANPLTGTTTADTITADAANNFHLIGQSITYAAGEATVSVYVKANGYTWFVIDPSITDAFGYYNITTGVVGTKGSACTTSITNVGGGWYRCSVTFTATAGAAICNFSIRNADNGGAFLGDGVSGFFIYGAQAETGVATDYIATTTAAVSVGPVANLPRLDYSGGATCGKLLLEGQRTNSLWYSENFDNAYWSKTGATITANTTTSPDGYVNADALVESSSTEIHAVFQNAGVTIAVGTATFSVFVKPNGRNFFQIRTGSAAGITNAPLYANFDLVNDLVTAQSVGANSAKIESYSNGWKRCSVSFTITSGSTVSLVYQPITSGTAVIAESYAGDGTSGIYLWGAQIEAGAYPTSYVNTLGAAVTRGLDAALKTSISSLIGQDEGTIFVEFEYNYSDSTIQVLFKVNQTNDANSVGIEVQGTTITALVNSGGGNIATIAGTIATGTIKAALAYKTNDMAFYVNGTQVGVDTSGSIAFAGVVDILTIGQFLLNGSPFFPASRPFNQALLFKTRLSNADLAALTA